MSVVKLGCNFVLNICVIERVKIANPSDSSGVDSVNGIFTQRSLTSTSDF